MLSTTRLQSTPTENQSPPSVVSIECNEPEGKVIRHVRFLVLSLENLKTFWEKARQHKTLFSAEIRDNFAEFLKVLVRQDSSGGIAPTGLFWVIDDFVGVFYLTDIKPGIDALCHYTFFDRRHTGREILCRAMIEYVFKTYKFHRLTTEVPLFTKPQVKFFVKSLGFRGEGMKRKAALFEGEWFNVLIYGILREEVENGRLSKDS